MAEGKKLDPWSSEIPQDYQDIIDKFGLEKFDKTKFPELNIPMRRDFVFAGRDLTRIANCIKENKPFYVLSGVMPTNDKIHFGTKHVIDQIRYFQELGGHAYILVADLESMASRGVSLEEAKKRAMEFHIPAYIALGLDPKKTTFYFQSENKDVIHLAYKFSKKVTSSEFRAIYGSDDPGRIMSAVTQCADILFPQTVQKMPGIIPVGIDQDPHIRLSRDIVKRTKSDHGFIPPSAVFHKFTKALNGKMKMSKSEPLYNLELPEDKKDYTKKINRAVTGGRPTLEEHRELGAEVEKCMVYEILKSHLVSDDEELKQIYEDYKSGKMTSGEIKQIAIKKMDEFMEDFNTKLEEAKKEVNELNFITFS